MRHLRAYVRHVVALQSYFRLLSKDGTSRVNVSLLLARFFQALQSDLSTCILCAYVRYVQSQSYSAVGRANAVACD